MAERSQPAVSVVIPAHDAGATVAATLDSVLAQMLADIEVVVVDHGSTDATAGRVGARAGVDARLPLDHFWPSRTGERSEGAS